MRKVGKISYLILVLVVFTYTATAQAADCPAILQQALTTANELCAGTGRNQVCYGAGTVSAVFQPSFEGTTLSKPGDIVDAAAIQSLTTAASDSEWGVALMRLQLNLADEQTDQNVTFLIVGDVTIESAITALPPSPEPITLIVTAAN